MVNIIQSQQINWLCWWNFCSALLMVMAYMVFQTTGSYLRDYGVILKQMELGLIYEHG